MSQYQLLDSGDFKKLEQVGDYRIVRPSASAVWRPTLSEKDWSKWDAQFFRHSDGGGDWKIQNKNTPESWTISASPVSFKVKLTGFGHMGVFYEQYKNWLQIHEIIKTRLKKESAPLRVLNLFAYTGGSTLFAAHAGAEVVHLDASKTSVQWARENAELSKLSDKPIRWIVDDVQEFVKKEAKRGRTYHGVILDPPSYGRGAKNQVWKIEDHMLPLLFAIKKIMAPDFLFLLLSSHSPGYTPVSLTNLLETITPQGLCSADEMVIEDTQKRRLPSGSYGLWVAK